MPEPQFKTTQDLIRALQLAKGAPLKFEWGRAVFLIGAGCSRSAGIPLSSEIAKRCVKQLAELYSNGRVRYATVNEFIPADAEAGENHAHDALTWLDDNVKEFQAWKSQPPDWRRIYTEIFENHLAAPGQQRQIITEAVRCGNGQERTPLQPMALPWRFIGKQKPPIT